MDDMQPDPNSPPDPVLQRNQAWAKPGSYTTALTPSQEAGFQKWAQANPDLTKEELSSPTPDYDVRGRWLADQQGDPDAKLVRSNFDGKLHANDKWKTPYHRTFSAESIYATPDAPKWQGNKLIDKSGNVLADETPGKPQPEADWDAGDYLSHGLQVPSFLKGNQQMADQNPIVPPGAGTSPPMQAPNMDVANQGAAQMSQQTNPAAAVMANIPPSPQAVDISSHDGLFGRAAKALMGNNTTYSVDANGKTVATNTPNTPGSFFRNVLSAAVLGGAAGAGSGANAAQGAAAGGAAVINHNQQQDQIKRQQAQEDFRNSQEADKANQQKMLTNATVANMHAETAARQQTTDLLSKEDHDKHNAATAALESGLRTAGGVDAQIPVNGVPKSDMTAPELGVAYAQDPSIRNGPDGFTRHFIDTTDSSDVTFNGVHWVTADGSPVNMTDKTTIKAIDVPDNAMNKKQMLQGDQLNKIGGNNIFDPKKSYPVSPQEADDMNAKRIVNEQKMALTNLEERKANIEASRVNVEATRMNHEFDKEKKDEFAGAARMVGENIKSLQAQAKDPMLDPKLKAHLNDQITQANAQLKQYYEKAYPGMKLAEVQQQINPSGPILHPQVVSILKSIPNFNPDIAEKFGNMSPEAIHDQVSSSSLPMDVKNKIMQAVGQPAIVDDSLGSKVSSFVKNHLTLTPSPTAYSK